MLFLTLLNQFNLSLFLVKSLQLGSLGQQGADESLLDLLAVGLVADIIFTLIEGLKDTAALSQ